MTTIRIAVLGPHVSPAIQFCRLTGLPPGQSASVLAMSEGVEMRFQIKPKLRSKLPVLAALALSCSAVVSSTALADELRTPRVTSESSERPARGMSMDKVEATYGAPSSRAAPIGQPPITRWEYPGFTVYFEHQHVIHTVAAG